MQKTVTGLHRLFLAHAVFLCRVFLARGLAIYFFTCLFDDVVEMLFDFFDFFYILGCEVCGGAVRRCDYGGWLSAASLTHETALVFVISVSK